MQKRKLQIFVSSTFIDLKEERQTAVQAILEAGHIPAGMELFIAGDASQWDIIKEWIDESDVYMLIIGGRYGSIEPKSGKSYTHLEYEYALSVSKPHFVIIIDDETTQNKAKKDGVKITDFFDNSSELKEFKTSIIQGKLVSICKNSDKMESSIHKSINKLSQRENLKGWVKADDTDYSSISEELARLSKENSELKSQLAFYNNSQESKVIEFLKNNNISDTYEPLHEYNIETLFDYFMSLAYELYPQQVGSEYEDLKRLRNHDLISFNSHRLTEKGKQLFSFIEINDVPRQNNPDITQNAPFVGAAYLGGKRLL
jgi:uncharacterized protein YutE (UPF0331/DUF86 family)